MKTNSMKLVTLKKKHLFATHKFCTNPDSCTNAEFYNNHLKYTAYGDYIDGKATTHILWDDDSLSIIGYVSVRCSSLILGTDSTAFWGKSALEITALAIDKQWEHMGYGEILISELIYIAYELCKKYTGVEAIVVAAAEEAKGFYEKVGFSELSDLYEIPAESFGETYVPMLFKLNFRDVFSTEHDNIETTQ